MKQPTLLILAAGLSSRYGSLKQMARFGPNGETLIDYAVFDGIRAGFGKVVFVIRQKIEDQFREFFASKFANRITVTHVLQETDTVPVRFKILPQRQKPWGTGHAVLVAASKISEPFAVINADDFYGIEALKMTCDHLTAADPEFNVVAYKLARTLSEAGPVSRAICEADEFGYLKAINEITGISNSPDGIVRRDQKGKLLRLSGDALVSMNLMGFTPSVFGHFAQYFEEFLSAQAHDSTAEFYLPWALNRLIKTNSAKVKMLPTESEWFGVTHLEDKEAAARTIRHLLNQGNYPENLWE